MADGVNTYDVFLSRNSRDKPPFEPIAEKLKGAGLEPWLDKWCLAPGGQWQAPDAGCHRAFSGYRVWINARHLKSAQKEILLRYNPCAGNATRLLGWETLVHSGPGFVLACRSRIAR